MLLCDKGVATESLLVSLGGILMYHIVHIKMLNANLGRSIENAQTTI